MVIETGYYDIFDLPVDCTSEDLKRAYRKLALRCHPDKDPSQEETFKSITQAYNVLSDPEKRHIYDTGGERAIKEGVNGSTYASRVYNAFCSATRLNNAYTDQNGRLNISETLGVSLEELYSGATKKMRIYSRVLCNECNGLGKRSPNVTETKCVVCNGIGRQITVDVLMRHKWMICEHCSGYGERIAMKDRCHHCNGKRVVVKEKQVSVDIVCGVHNGHSVTVRGEGHYDPMLRLTGDLCVTVVQHEHRYYVRTVDDLRLTMNVTLTEALCGFSRKIVTVDKRVVLLRSPPGHVIKPDIVKILPGKGMPRYLHPYYKGKLFIKFTVEFPRALFPRVVTELERVLPQPKPVLQYSLDAIDVERVMMVSADIIELDLEELLLYMEFGRHLQRAADESETLVASGCATQ